ncbi:hypothetical protein MAPG_07783 [Magnaporthiopsis poae ATCC 64411]|uniref:Uncharacterized protein n=1 Tax=Magnaporthiopsis poae (strain ATCC 64411 / 73-15) TaxID=644358 RepID=A0A0C4E5L1_MAGP6|nr:hypothetical protein MAPG_07783 [Magnaporthiopsis poae ATCC 64411]
MSGSVYLGVWKNYQSDTLTLTVTQDVGSILIAALALFVSLSMGHLWSIICFFVHQVRSTPNARSGLHHQRQALLRNTTTAAATSWMLVRLAWTWRGKSRGVFRGSIALLPIAILFVALLTGSSLLSSRIQLLDSDVLLTGRECGRLPLLEVTNGKWDPTLAQAVAVERKWSYDRATEYGQTCYGPAIAGDREPSVCKDFPASKVPISMHVDVPCPFTDDICVQPNGAMTLDTGLVDSNTHLGINAPPEERIKYQRILTCAPIKTENYSSPWTAERPSGVLVGRVPPTGIVYKTYNLGPYALSNYTLAVSNKTTDTPYYLKAIRSLAFDRDSSSGPEWKPIPPLAVENADVTLIILRNEAMYQTPVHDPWFRATAVGYKNGLNGEGYYTADQMPASFVACTERHRVCSSETSCTPFGGVSQNATAPASVGVDDFGAYDAGATGVRLNAQQKAAHDLLQQDLFGAMEKFVERSTRALRALDFVVYIIGQLGVDEQHVVRARRSVRYLGEVHNSSLC